MNIYQRDHKVIPAIFTLIREHRNEEAKKYLHENPLEISLKGWMDDTPLHIASSGGNYEMVKYLVDNGADVNARRSGQYATPLCWADNYTIAEFLLSKGATMNDQELELATRQDKTEIVDLLLSSGAKIQKKEPQYLQCKSVACIQAYLKYEIDLNGCDKTRSTLLHKLAWGNLPEVFDFAYNKGCQWSKDSSNRTPYVLARQGNRKEMLLHFKTHYPTLLTNRIDNIEVENYQFERVFYLRQSPTVPEWLFALTGTGKVVRYSVVDNALHIDKAIQVDVPTIRNFTFDRNSDIIIPTADNSLLVVDQHSLQLRKRIALEENLEPDQIEYLPSKNIYISSYTWTEIIVHNENLKIAERAKAESGTIYPLINPQENLISFFSYDHETHFVLYELTDNQEIRLIRSFWKNGPSSGFAFNGYEFAVSYPHELEYYRFVNGDIEKLWAIDISPFRSKHHLSYLVFADNHTIVLGKGKALYYIDTQNQKVTRSEQLNLAAEIRDLFLCNQSLIVSTNAELKLVPFNARTR